MSELLTKIENHIALGLDASPGFFLSMDDMKEIAAALRTPVAVGMPGEVAQKLLEICDGSNWPEYAQEGDGYRAYSEITEQLHELVALLPSPTNQGDV